MKEILMTIKPRHLANLRKGVKPYELRRARPARPGTYRVWLCESGTGGRVVATFVSRHFMDMAECSAATIARLGHVTLDEARGYQAAGGPLYGWQVEDFVWFKDTGREKSVGDFGWNRPPQSWGYVKEGFEIED